MVRVKLIKLNVVDSAKLHTYTHTTLQHSRMKKERNLPADIDEESLKFSLSL